MIMLKFLRKNCKKEGKKATLDKYNSGNRKKYIFKRYLKVTETQCVFILKYYDYTCFESRVFYQDFLNRDIGRNHVNETARHGIVAHRLWEENLGNVNAVFVNNSFRFVARSLLFRCPKAISERNNFGLLYHALRFRLCDCAPIHLLKWRKICLSLDVVG